MIENDSLLFPIHIIKKKDFIYSKGAISERGVDNLGVSLYKYMLYSYQVISLSLPNVRYDDISLNKW